MRVLVILLLITGCLYGSNRVAVVVNDELYDEISGSINVLINDYEAEGWEPVLIRWDLESRGDPRLLRETLRELYDGSKSLNGAVFIGDLPIAHFEILESNTNASYLESDKILLQWNGYPADEYYMDLLGSEWQDLDGDNKFDSPAFKDGEWNEREIWVSRITASGINLYSGKSEADLIRDYLKKNHDYRVGRTGYRDWNIFYWHGDEATKPQRGWFNSSVPSMVISGDTHKEEFKRVMDSASFKMINWAIHGFPAAVIFDKKIPGGTSKEAQALRSSEAASWDGTMRSLFLTMTACTVGLHTYPNYIAGTLFHKPESQVLGLLASTIPTIVIKQTGMIEALESGKSWGEAYLENLKQNHNPHMRAQVTERSRVLFGDGTLKYPRFMSQRGGVGTIYPEKANYYWDWLRGKPSKPHYEPKGNGQGYKIVLNKLPVDGAEYVLRKYRYIPGSNAIEYLRGEVYSGYGIELDLDADLRGLTGAYLYTLTIRWPEGGGRYSESAESDPLIMNAN